MSWTKNPQHWKLDGNTGSLYRESGVLSNKDLLASSNLMEFKPDKNYITISTIKNIPHSDWKGDSLGIYSFGNGYIVPSEIPNNINNKWFLYLYNSPSETIESTIYATFKGNEDFNSSSGGGIENCDVIEEDWKVFGYSWVNTAEGISKYKDNSANDNKNSICPGWIKEGTSWSWIDIKDSTLNPKDINHESLNNKSINFVYKFIKYNFFNIIIDYIDLNLKGKAKVYTSDLDPTLYTNDITKFNDLIDNKSELILDLNKSSNSPETVEKYGIEGIKYIFIVADSCGSDDNQVMFSMTNIKIEGGYHESNNKLHRVNSNDVSPINIGGANYTALSGIGFKDKDIEKKGNLNKVTSRIGNGWFLSGKWENGVWNNGWRSDNDILELYDIGYAVKIYSDIKWRFSLIGDTNVVNSFDIGDEVSIGNIIGVDLNENRKILKGSYKIISKTQNGQYGEDLDYIEVEVETTFPLMRIEKDSKRHRIYITKNIWLSGAFLNGYFTGIWNDGLFKGYPDITKMEKSHWIDGRIDGGHFESRPYDEIEFDEILYSGDKKVGLSFSSSHSLFIGDEISIEILDDDEEVIYNDYTKVTEVKNKNLLEVDINWDDSLEGLSGIIKTNFNDGVIQNINIKSNNISKKTTSSTTNHKEIFIYNTWIDVVFGNDSAVNIGRPQKLLNKTSRRSYSKNNLYGRPTEDVLSSVSEFRDSYSINERYYNLGTKLEKYDDFIGESSNFSEYFGPEGDELELFLDQGWTFSVANGASMSFSRTDQFSDNIDESGEELVIESSKGGGILDIKKPKNNIKKRAVREIEKDRYTMVEFDVINSSIDKDNKDTYVYKNTVTKSEEPILNFNNINNINETQGSGLIQSISILKYDYLPDGKNINHLLTDNKRKVEYFFNKENLSMVLRGAGENGENDSSVTLNNIKLFEVDMIPFFKYFTEDNINNSIQVPLKAKAPFIDYNDDSFSLLDNIDIGLDTISMDVDKVFNPSIKFPSSTIIGSGSGNRKGL